VTLSILLRTAQGDAYGAGFEYGSAAHVAKHNTLTGFVKNEKHDLTPGHYTDDAQMSLANAEVILSGRAITREVLAESYVSCFKRDKRLGYASGFYNLLCEIENGDTLLARLGAATSDKSGGAMRAVVWGIYPTIEQVTRLTELQARITHNTTDGVNAALAAALMGHYFFYDLGPKRNLGRFLQKHVKGNHCDWAKRWDEPVGPKGWQSVHAAVTAVMRHNSLSSILKACVAYTGDVDTVAAVALGAACASHEVANDLPAWLDDQLENGACGRDYLIAKDVELSERLEQFRQD
jgi:ADP-ribosyl-[dinitrogen reductase] hydrolase